MTDMIEVFQGDSPLVLGLPHTGTDVPADVWEGLNETGRALGDTDWHIHDLYAGLAVGASTVRTKIHRYVIDVNRDPAGESLYPGQNTTGLCPTTDFDGLEIHREGQILGNAEVARRRDLYHAPYHTALRAELARVRGIHGFAVLYDCHSIRANIPFLFESKLPDFNIGTNLGTTCAPEIETLVVAGCGAATGYTNVLNGRFKGGWTTRHYGQPLDGIHAIQMELAQSAYLSTEAAPWPYDSAKSATLRGILGGILQQLSEWKPT